MVQRKKQKPDQLRYAANLTGAVAAVYIVSGVILRFLAEKAVRIFHVQATLENPIGVPESVIALLSAVTGAVSLLAAIRFARSMGKPVFSMRIPLSDPKDRRVWLLVPVFLGFGLICSVLSSVIQSVLESVTYYTAPDATKLPQDGLALLLCFVSMCIVPAVLEEILVRGCLQGFFLRWGVWFSICVSSFVFTLLHADIAQMPAIFLLSVFLGICAYITDSLLPGIVLHFANNAMSFLFLYIQQRMDGRTAIGAVIYLFAILFFCAALSVWRIVSSGMLQSLRLPTSRPSRPAQRKRGVRLLRAPVFAGMICYLFVRALWPLLIKG